MSDHDSNSLIDWSGPVVEYINKPLIPLPSFDNPIDIAEDNPFDVVERRINENELLDIFNINLSFNEYNDTKCEEDAIHELSQEIIIEDEDDFLDRGSNLINAERIDDDASKTSPKQNEDDFLNGLCISNLSNLSDFKEMIQTRISSMNQAFNQSKSSVMPSLSENEKSTYSSEPADVMNNSFILRNNELKDSDFMKSTDGVECEDLQSIKLNWDDYLVSSSDEENEKVATEEKQNPSKQIKKTSAKPVEKMKDVRAPLISQDPNIRIKKMNAAFKRGPLKAIVPVTDLKKLEAKISSNGEIVTSSKSKITSTHLSKLKKWCPPIAASTPHNSKNTTPNISRRSSVSNLSTNSSIKKKSSLSSHPPSPDSTTDFKVFSRSVSISRSTTKNQSKNVSSNVVSSSTKADLSKTPLKASNNVGSRSTVRNVRNKENLKPFRN